MPDKYLFQEAKDAVNRLTNKQKSQIDKANNQAKQAAQHAIQIAYQGCSSKERDQLQQLEAELNQENPLQS